MKYTVETKALPYSTIVLHCLKYPAKGIIGLLIGSKKDNRMTITECVPLSHESTPLPPSLEIATSLVHSKFGSSLVGVYFSNATPNDNSLNPYAIRLADRISSVTNAQAVLIQVMSDRLVADCEDDRLVAYEKDGESWKSVNTAFGGTPVLRGIKKAMEEKLHRELNDFETHLDNPENDFYNTNLSKKISQTAELRA